MSLKVAVIGGGNGGFATASQMALAGHEVHLFELPDFSANIAELKETPVIEVSGALLTGEARLAGVSCDPADGFSDCEIVLVTTQTLGHIPTARLSLITSASIRASSSCRGPADPSLSARNWTRPGLEAS